MPTVVFVHAHPDDEALLTSGTMARLSERGYRVVLVMATDGAAGLTSHEISHDHNLAQVRASELTESCRVLGVSGFHQLGYADSGLDGRADVPAGATRFADVDPGVVADRLVALFEEEEADVVVGYDSAGDTATPITFRFTKRFNVRAPDSRGRHFWKPPPARTDAARRSDYSLAAMGCARAGRIGSADVATRVHAKVRNHLPR